MPVRDGLPASERRRHIPPRDTTTGPPEHPVEHRAVIGPPPTTTRDLVGQQRFQTSPFHVGQIVSMQHPPGLPHPALKIRGTCSSAADRHRITGGSVHRGDRRPIPPPPRGDVLAGPNRAARTPRPAPGGPGTSDARPRPDEGLAAGRHRTPPPTRRAA